MVAQRVLIDGLLAVALDALDWYDALDGEAAWGERGWGSSRPATCRVLVGALGHPGHNAGAEHGPQP